MAKPNIKPLGSRILIMPKEAEETTKGGLIIPDTIDNKKNSVGEVVALGTGKKDFTFEMKVGDTVYFSGFPQEIEDGDKTYVIIDAENVLAIL